MAGQIGYTGYSGGDNLLNSFQLVKTDLNFSGTTRDVTITSVDSNFVLIQPMWNFATSGGLSRDICNIELTSATNIRLTKSDTLTSGTSIFLNIYEYNPDFVRSNQFVNGTFTSGSFKDITISSVNTDKCIIVNHGYNTDESTFTNVGTAAELTSTTNARIYVVASTATATVRAQILEFN